MLVFLSHKYHVPKEKKYIYICVWVWIERTIHSATRTTKLNPRTRVWKWNFLNRPPAVLTPELKQINMKQVRSDMLICIPGAGARPNRSRFAPQTHPPRDFWIFRTSVHSRVNLCCWEWNRELKRCIELVPKPSDNLPFFCPESTRGNMIYPIHIAFRCRWCKPKSERTIIVTINRRFLGD